MTTNKTQLDRVKAELPPLRECAVLYDLNIGGLSAARVHKAATVALAIEHGSDKTQAKVTFNLVCKEAVAPVGAAATALREFYKKYTVEYVDTHYRVCGIEQVDFFERGLRRLSIPYEEEADNLAAKIEGYQQDQRHRLGTLAPNPKDYLTADDIRARFRVKWNRQEIPDGGGDWRFNTTDPKLESVLQRIRSEEAQKHAEAANNLSNAVFEVAREEFEKISEKLRRYEVEQVSDGKGGIKEKRSNRWVTNLVEQVHDLARRLPILNVQSDPRIEALITEVNALSASLDGITDDDLRKDEGQRLTVADKADEILNELAGYGG